jgi:hypothetical protein
MSAIQKDKLNDKRKDRLKVLKSGYDGLFKAINEDLTLFAPDKDETAKEMFLDESQFADRRDILKGTLNSLIELLEGSSSAEEIHEKGMQMAEKSATLRKKNLSAIVAKAKPLEKSYRELALFYRNAGPNALKNLTIVNVDREMVKDADDETITTKVNEILADPHLRVDQDKVYSLMVIPDFLGEQLIQSYTTIADENKVLFFGDYRDMPNVEALLKYRDTEQGRRVGGGQKYWSHAVMLANHVRMREKHADLNEKDDMYGSPAMAIAGKLYATKISQPAAGVQFGEVKNSLGLRFSVNQPQVGMMSKVNINPMMNAYGQDMPFEAKTMFDGENLELKHYAVVRTLDWIDKSIKHFLGKYTFEQVSKEKADGIRRSLIKFFEDLVEQKIIDKASIKKFERNRDQPDRFDIDIDIVPLWAVRTMVYKIGVTKDGAETEMG